jgi:hypothetical protein
MDIDVTNPVVKLCAAAIQAEMSGDTAGAVRLSAQAWDSRKTDYDGCIAAHYLARYQESAVDWLLWNRRALDAATAVDNGIADSFYASLHLNLGQSYEDLGNLPEAERQYLLALNRLADVPDGSYREILAAGIASAIQRIHSRKVG